MFRDDEPGEVDLQPFAEYYEKSKEEAEFIAGPASWTQVIEHDGKEYVAKARLLRTGQTSSGFRKYDPEKPNFYGITLQVLLTKENKQSCSEG